MTRKTGEEDDGEEMKKETKGGKKMKIKRKPETAYQMDLLGMMKDNSNLDLYPQVLPLGHLLDFHQVKQMLMTLGYFFDGLCSTLLYTSNSHHVTSPYYKLSHLIPTI